MPKYHVDLQEVWIQTVEVEADSPKEAQQRVLNGEGDYLDGRLEYSHSLESTHDTRLADEDQTG